jgi:hypothetical protein
MLTTSKLDWLSLVSFVGRLLWGFGFEDGREGEIWYWDGVRLVEFVFFWGERVRYSHGPRSLVHLLITHLQGNYRRECGLF